MRKTIDTVINMPKITKINQKRLEVMAGCLVQSLNYADCVYINRQGKVFDGYDGVRVLDTLNTNSKISKLWKECFYDEFGSNTIVDCNLLD